MISVVPASSEQETTPSKFPALGDSNGVRVQRLKHIACDDADASWTRGFVHRVRHWELARHENGAGRDLKPRNSRRAMDVSGASERLWMIISTGTYSRYSTYIQVIGVRRPVCRTHAQGLRNSSVNSSVTTRPGGFKVTDTGTGIRTSVLHNLAIHDSGWHGWVLT